MRERGFDGGFGGAAFGEGADGEDDGARFERGEVFGGLEPDAGVAAGDDDGFVGAVCAGDWGAGEELGVEFMAVWHFGRGESEMCFLPGSRGVKWGGFSQWGNSCGRKWELGMMLMLSCSRTGKS